MVLDLGVADLAGDAELIAAGEENACCIVEDVRNVLEALHVFRNEDQDVCISVGQHELPDCQGDEPPDVVPHEPNTLPLFGQAACPRSRMEAAHDQGLLGQNNAPCLAANRCSDDNLGAVGSHMGLEDLHCANTP